MSPKAGLDLTMLLREAVNLANEQGYHTLSLGELAKRLRVRPPSLYNHIEGLPSLKQKLAVHGLEILNQRMAQAAIGRSKDEAVLAMSRAYAEFAREQPGLYEATFHAPDSNDPAFRKAQQDVLETVVQVFRSYQLEEETTTHLIRGIRSLLHGFSSIEQAGGFGLALDMDQSLQLCLETFLAGIPAVADERKETYG